MCTFSIILTKILFAIKSGYVLSRHGRGKKVERESQREVEKIGEGVLKKSQHNDPAVCLVVGCGSWRPPRSVVCEITNEKWTDLAYVGRPCRDGER